MGEFEPGQLVEFTREARDLPERIAVALEGDQLGQEKAALALHVLRAFVRFAELRQSAARLDEAQDLSMRLAAVLERP